MKDIHVEFHKICLDVDHNSVQMTIKEIEGEDIILHFSNSSRVKLLSEIQNHLYNTRQEFKQYMRKIKQEEEQKELELRLKISQETSKEFQKELKIQLQKILEAKEKKK